MNMIRAAICDDEPLILSQMKTLVAKSGLCHESNISVFAGGKALLDAVEKQRRQFDVVFLDVDMPGLSGFQTAQRLQELEAACLLVFVTNMEQHAREGYKYSAFRYIFKRGLDTEVPEAVAAVLEKLKLTEKEKQTVSFKYKDAGVFETLEICRDDILYLWLDKSRRVYMKTVYSEYDLLVKPLTEYQNTLDTFCLLMRSHLLNFSHVADMVDDSFVLSNGERISMGFTKETVKSSKEKYLQYLRERL